MLRLTKKEQERFSSFKFSEADLHGR